MKIRFLLQLKMKLKTSVNICFKGKKINKDSHKFKLL